MNMHVKAKAELKAGDRVRVTHTDYPDNMAVGMITKIARIDSDGDAWLAEREGDDDGLFFFGWEFEPVKFAVGDKVRALETSYGEDYKKGNVYTVKSVSFEFDNLTTEFDEKGSTSNGWRASAFEPAPTYSSCAAAEVDNLADEYGGGRKATVRKPGYRFTNQDRPSPGDRVSIGVQGTFTVKDVTADGYIQFTDRPAGHTWMLHATESSSDCTLVQAASTLRIEAGKFYKTRDGRKVGPARLSEYPSAKCKWSLGELWLYQDNGTSGNAVVRTADLVAEWQDEPAAKFKVGDRVRILRHENNSGNPVEKNLPIGSAHSIVKITDQIPGVQCCILSGSPINFWTPKDLELIPPTTIADIVRKHASEGTAIVALIENGQPKPATRPYVHADRASATAEADRLSNVNKGQEFGVYELVDVKNVERTYHHEWQRLAAGGSKIPAIKAYRDAGGRRQTFVAAERGWPGRYEDRHVIGLKEAKDAVEHWLTMVA
ncbi:MAG: hypothetical protein EOS04_24465 [Mesorhizobium sp.]|nr:MAG: hypothetical protein EOR98_26805 [Mesorhizobium sp.]RWN73149.1 MAG: hypothetical protein EOS01_26750 [Mesorhizobium sp.]RWN85197.1 MAG: hypothetical protein EOS04_24465 [Mesorhizobium sp.]